MASNPAVFIAVTMALGACGPRIDLGSQVLWSARHETGDLNEWLADAQGGFAANPPTTTIAATAEFAHDGTHAVKLTNAAVADHDTARLWREGPYPADAYYSAWYYLPEAYLVPVHWTIMQFRAPSSQDPSIINQLLDLDIRGLPGGELILVVFDHRAPYLGSPTPPTALPLPIGRWFQLEVLFRNRADDRGRLVVWLDGQVNYDIQRPFGTNSTVYWSPCSSGYDLSPPDAPIYVDDAAISLTRLTPTGSL